MRILLSLLLVFMTSWAIMPAKYIDNDLMDKLDEMEPVPVDNTRWAFIIAIEDYENTDEVAYSKNSGKLFELLAQKKLGIGKRHIYTLINDKATAGRINDTFEKLLANVKKGDTVFFYYSGHGVPIPEENNEPYILPVDKSLNNLSRSPEFKLSNIYKKLAASKASHIVAFVDSCFSGATDKVSVFKGVAAPRLVAKKVEVDRSKMSVMTAGADKQFSNMYKEKRQRLFTYFLVEGIAQKNYTDLKQLFQYVKYNVANTSEQFGDVFKQVPTFEGNIKESF